MGGFTKTFIKFLISIIISYLVGILITSLLRLGTISFSKEILTDTITIAISCVVLLALFIWFLVGITEGNNYITGKKRDKSDTKQFFDSKFLSEQEINKKFTYTLYSNLKNIKDGVPIRAECRKGKLHINLQKPIHTMVIGTTGSGKTTMYVDPTIQILSETKSKPCLVITDPKGELYDLHAYKLSTRGYKIKVLNLRDVYSSTRWNPMDRAYSFYQRSLNIEKEVIIHKGDNPKDFKLETITKVYNNEWYEFNKTAYPTKQLLMNDLIAKKRELENEAQEDLNDIATTLCPIENQNDPSWDMGAKNFVLGIMLAMLEDSANTSLGMTRERFNFYNMSKIANYRDNDDPDNPFKTVKKYLCEGREKLSTVPQLAGPIVNSAPNTTRSYLGIVATRLAMFSDMGVCFATSFNDMHFETFASEPTAFFIIIPDEKQTRHGIASMCIIQLYKTLVEIASVSPDRHLPRNVYFVLDEFGNLPKISSLDNIITVGRSRGIFMILVVQSYTQLNNVYGDKIADIVRTNCNIQVFIGTNDAKTKDEFSKMCGQISVKTKSESKGEKADSKNISTGEASRPLIYPEELELLPKNTTVVKVYHENPIKAVFTPQYLKEARRFYLIKSMPKEYSPAQTLDEHKVFYDISERNTKVLGSSGMGDFDF